MQEERRYNYCLDFVKGIACILVVLIHCKFPGRVGLSVQAVARFAVPLFFMVSGYYCYRGGQYTNNQVITKKIVKIAKMTFSWYLFYLFFFVVENWLFKASHVFDFSLTHILHVAVFNQPSNVPPHFWFLFALINVYLLFLLVNALKVRKIGYVFSLVMFALLIALQQGASLMGYSITPYYFRNFLIEGFPFFMLGHFLHENKEKCNVSNVLLLIIVGISAVLSIGERFMFKSFIKVFLSTYPLVVCLFVYAINNPYRHRGMIQLLGKNLSMPVYILHWFVMIVVDRMIKYYEYEGISYVQWLRPIAVIGITILLGFLYHKLSTIRLKKCKLVNCAIKRRYL